MSIVWRLVCLCSRGRRSLRLFQLQVLETLRLRQAAVPSFYEKLNTRWHERALQGFMFIVLAHWGEHLVQAYQIYVMGWPRPKANGILGLWYPWLIQSEALHYGYALIMLIGIWVLRKGFTGTFAEMVDGRAGDPILASHRAFSADLAGHVPPQFLGQAGTVQRFAASLSARRTPPLLQLGRVHPHGDRRCTTTCFHRRVSRERWPAPANGVTSLQCKLLDREDRWRKLLLLAFIGTWASDWMFPTARLESERVTIEHAISPEPVRTGPSWLRCDWPILRRER